MGLLSTAIDNLSNLALNEASTVIPDMASPAIVDEMKAMLEMMDSLTEEECKIPAYAVPLKENHRLGRYLIEMEDLSRYMITNQVANILEAVDQIGKANHIALSNKNVALVIDEASILQEMDDLGINIGPSSNEGNIGDTGLLGKHLDLGKFRRFANSKELVDTIANKYGLPVVKKNYNIGLVQTKRGDEIKHDGNVNGNMAPGENIPTGKPDTSGISGNIHESAETAELKPTGPNTTVLNEPDKSGSNSVNKNSNSSLDESMQYLRDIAAGKFDDAILAEEAGGELMQPVR